MKNQELEKLTTVEIFKYEKVKFFQTNITIPIKHDLSEFRKLKYVDNMRLLWLRIQR